MGAGAGRQSRKAASGGVNFSFSVRHRAMGDFAFIDVEPVAQMRILAERAAIALVGERQHERQA